MSVRHRKIISDAYEECFRLSFWLGLLIAIAAIAAVTAIQQPAALWAAVAPAGLAFLVTFRRRRSRIRGVSGAIFLGCTTGLGIVYLVWSTYAYTQKIPPSDTYGGKIFVTDQGIVIRGPINSRSHKEWKEIYTPEVQSQKLPVFLNSNGGDIAAAKAIAHELSASKMQVFVASDAVCKSACTVIFAAGARRFADPKAIFHFHSSREAHTMPYLTPISYLKPSDEDQLEAFKPFPVLFETLTASNAWNTDEGVSGPAKQLHDNRDSSFLELREIEKTPSLAAE